MLTEELRGFKSTGFMEGPLFFETPCSMLRALPRVAKVIENNMKLTIGHMIARCDQFVHVIVHSDELVLRKRLLLFSIDQSF